MQPAFSKWCEKLLDTGKGNKLINFKSSTLRSVDIVCPEPKQIFHKLQNGISLNFYDIDKDILAERSEKLSKQDQQKLVEEASKKLKKNEILAIKTDCTLRRALSNIKKIANVSLVEKGINILYIAFGFLKWKEQDNAPAEFLSPLVLIPIKLENASKNQPFVLSVYEDEITTNPTLLYKLKNEHGIDLPEFRMGENEDETLDEYYARILSKVKNLGWTIEDKASIGTFSFLKINMYQDLKENETTFLKNSNIKRLLNIKFDEEPIPQVDLDKYFAQGKEMELHNVVDADSSQMSAIIAAKHGQSFVLQGPPGTGKSQTITNLIAEFLYDGKKVLFVSEKLAALNVVYNNLKKAELSDFCLELHSNKTNKKDVINELYRVLNQNRKIVKNSASRQIVDLLETKCNLDTYAEVLHTPINKINKTPFEIITEVCKLKNAPEVEYAFDDINQKGEDFLTNSTSLLESYVAHSAQIGADYHKNLWYGYQSADSTYKAKTSTKSQIEKSLDFVSSLEENVSKLNKALGTKFGDYDSIDAGIKLLEFLPKLKFFDAKLFDITNIEEILNAVRAYNKNVQSMKDSAAEVSLYFENEFYELNANELYLKFRNDYMSSMRIFNSKYRKDKKILESYQKDKKARIGYTKMVELLKHAKNVQSLKPNLEDAEKALFVHFAQEKENKSYDWKNIEFEIELIKNSLTPDFAPLSKLSQAQFEKSKQVCIEFVKFFDKAKTQKAELGKLQDLFDNKIVDFSQMKFGHLSKKLAEYLEKFDGLENWIRFYSVLCELESNELVGFVDACIAQKIAKTGIVSAFRKSYFAQWLYYILDCNPTLHNFSRLLQDSNVAKFKEQDKLRFEISKAEIVSKLSQEMPNPNNMASGSQVSTLVREANKKSKQKPVRLLLKEIGGLVQTLKPCFLMSPLSVSTYLDSDTCKFDVVVFDEASQIFPWDAVGAIARSKQVIVVGDSKQMPPSNFFMSGMVDDEMADEDEYDDDSLDFESILDLCTAVFPQNRLSWHYRSKTEDLIAFSNYHFYDGSLTTFPSAHKDNPDTGIDFYYVDGGVFDRRTKTNKIEAERVVDLVFEHAKKHPDRSLGVVAFSISQQETIEDLIQKRREQKDLYPDFFDQSKPEPFFVKNLETVQGDERDTIIFSIAYAKDSSGKFIHNFGPLNKKGGERRLNVAITRAKVNVKLVASIRSYDINLKNTESLGAKLLKQYLDCAENGIGSVSTNNIVGKSEHSKDFERDIYETLKSAGFAVDMQVGCSGYRVDVGVKHPKLPEYVLAIECDGENYHASKTTRDRDRLRQEVLERLGWKFYRVWSTDWFQNNETEKARLIEACRQAIAEYDKSDKSQKQTSNDKQKTDIAQFIVEKEVGKSDLKELFPVYEPYDEFYDQSLTLGDRLLEIIKKEGPITQDLLFKKALPFFKQSKVTPTMKRQILGVLSFKRGVFKIDDYFTTDPNKTIELRLPKSKKESRDISMIANAELESGLLKIVENNVGVTKEGLFKTITSLLGYNHTGNTIQMKLTQALYRLVQSGRVKKIGLEYFVNK